MPFYVGNVISKAGECTGTGIVDTTFIDPDCNNAVNAIAIQADNKIVIGGTFTTVGGVTQNRIARLNYDGTLDTSFNTGGTIGVNGAIESIAIQADQKIVIGGRFTTCRGTTQNRIARLNTNGTRDTTFNTGGTVGVDGNVFAVVVQPDQKILVGGIFLNARGTVQNRFCRLNTDGTLDTGFNTGGTIGADGTVRCFAVMSNNQILTGGSFNDIRGVTQNGIAKLNTDGTVDTSFNTGVDPGVFGPGDVYDILIQDTGKIILAGDFTSFRDSTLGFSSPEITRANADGTRDTSWTRPFPNNSVLTIEKQFDEKVFVGGLYVDLDSVQNYYMGRINENGSVDTTFNTGAPVGVTAARPGGYVFCSALQDDCRIVIGGAFTEVRGITRNRVCRLA